MTDLKSGQKSLAALLIDLENLYYSLADEYYAPSDVTMAILQTVREHMLEKMDLSPVIGKAYAPFDYSIARVLMNDLALMGISPVHVLAFAKKNSADLMLAIDAMEILFRRTDINTFVIVGGDRDYIPVVERIRQNAKSILIVSPRTALSGDLLTIVGQENYLDPLTIVPKDRIRTKASVEEPVPRVPSQPTDDPVLTPSTKEQEKPESPKPTFKKETTPTVKAPPPSSPKAPTTMKELNSQLEDKYEMEDLIKCMGTILSFIKDRHVQEVWLSPFLRVMNDEFPLKANWERKRLLSRLEELSAVRIEERPRNDDEGGTYAVMMVNWSHPLVIETNPG